MLQHPVVEFLWNDPPPLRQVFIAPKVVYLPYAGVVLVLKCEKMSWNILKLYLISEKNMPHSWCVQLYDKFALLCVMLRGRQ